MGEEGIEEMGEGGGRCRRRKRMRKEKGEQGGGGVGTGTEKHKDDGIKEKDYTTSNGDGGKKVRKWGNNGGDEGGGGRRGRAAGSTRAHIHVVGVLGTSLYAWMAVCGSSLCHITTPHKFTTRHKGGCT